MLRKPLLTLFCALALAAAFFYGVTRLFVLRYERGDVYPPYSTLRADPLGTKGIYDALDQLPGVEASRHFRALPKLKPAGPITLVYPGVAHRAYWEDRELRHFNGLVLAGTRAVFTFLPFESAPLSAEEKRADAEERAKKEKAREEKKKPRGKKLGAGQKDADAKPADEKKADGDKKSDDKKDEDEEDRETTPAISFGEVANRWGFSFDYLPADKEKSFDRQAVLADEKSKLEPKLTWHTALCFKDLKPEWRVLYRCAEKPVVIERRFGRGSIVLAADSFFLSNEALRDERHPKLLAWLFEGPSTLVFDEEHHGVRDDPGIASLARKYRLHGVVAGILLIAALFVWKNAVRFIPAYADSTRDGDVVIGKESGEGFTNLLRRTIKPSEILAVCAAEWRKSATHPAAEQARVEELLAENHARPTRQRNPVSTYQSIAQTLSRH